MAASEVNRMTLEDLSTICMEMIGYAGEGRSLTYEAINLFVNDKFQQALEKLEEAEKFLSEAHRMQYEKLMAPQFQGEEIPCSVLMLHAMDLTLISTSEHDLLKALITAKIEKNND